MPSTDGIMSQEQWKATFDLRDLFVAALRRNVPADADALEKEYSRAWTDFLSTQVPISETQAAFNQLVDLADEEKVRDAYAGFLDAPLASAEDEDAAIATLCRVSGSLGVMPMTREVICFKDEEKKVWFLVAKLLQREENKTDTVRKQVVDLVQSEPKLPEMVTKYYKLMDMSEENVEAMKSRGETFFLDI
ncbi:uncharacterized protein ColSpa_10751 [Colletotrichum spaethianum]|uniref:Uncharacterized protein n=1 Tax=Colletotrichum spaethianum TaxID=700344 RepID=A0AA37PE10_9PEZI|nr:uncharacterized protein ColSpa_10751 [Colletotrichum spaethianum]GKT50570.1 hypothetical protein ColSpa_10751 [Colletotrichum spaethianum]